MLSALLAITLTVQPGQTLSGIAASHGVSLAAVEAANPQIGNPNLIYAGQAIHLPGGGGGASGASAPAGDNDGDRDGSGPAPAAAPAPAPMSSPANTGAPASAPGGISIPGMPQGLANCIWFRESTNGTNPAAGGNQFGIIPASGYNVAGMSVSQQEQVAGHIYATVGGSAWAADGCPGT